MKRALNLGTLSRIVEGDPNEVTNNEILVIRDNLSGKIEDIQVRGTGGVLESVLVERVAFTIKATPTDATVTINNTNRDTVIVTKGSTVQWSVSKTGYTPQSGSQIVDADTVKDVTLAQIVS
ncbi:hypothetical protein [Kehishuvirus tikkala]|jgi:hypothetical protein|uniref:HFD-like domain-containing protein n=1 Tax=Kehishuvirus sp. 'tikkala' TaxID=3028513 RepID=A0AAF0ICX4_9CAUD|nr:hypothetical protein [Kehishuvirus sp. 'tikkala']